MTRVAFVAAAALAVAGSSAAAATAMQAPAARPAHASTAAAQVRRACAVVNHPGAMYCMALIRTDVKQRTTLRGQKPVGFGYGPANLQSAYKLPSSTAGAGQTVAVVDAYNDPNAVSDFNFYRSAWGLPACNSSTGAGCLHVVNQNGAASPLPANSGSTGWATEESLDVDMVAAICPQCKVYLVEANSPTIGNLGTAVNSAVSVVGAKFVSNSYGGSQSSNDTTFDNLYYKHAGVAVTVSAGDSGYGVQYPAASQYVTSVGGTALTKTTGGRGWTETVWPGTGSGCATASEPKPPWQTHGGCAHRIDNDVAAVASPGTGVAVYDTYDQGGWLELGGTSVSSPIIASVFALAGTPAAGTYPSSYIYAHHTGNIYDVTVGSNGSCGTRAFLCTAEVGFDGPTGWGTPHGTAAFHS
ncbi:MAG TPA: S53 family peptidase [Streptosporangiaceae bacterium]|nr:S53 family peptidase [Streptosporangiaceae bacterium]